MNDSDSGDLEGAGASEGVGNSDFATALKSITVTMPTREELYASCRPWYDQNSATFIDRWPDRLLALSFPTKLIPFDSGEFCKLWGHSAEALIAADKISAALDAHMGWRNWFVRLNTRSPKDAAYPALPVTCSGKQAVSWIMGSERCLDDATALHAARAPLFVCLREYHHMHKSGEFRCFAKDGEVLGVTRYFYDEQPPADTSPDGAKIMAAARKFFADHLAADYPTIVFDLYAPGSDCEKLIEINPYGESDPCLFAGYEDIEVNGGFRWAAQTVPQSPEAANHARDALNQIPRTEGGT